MRFQQFSQKQLKAITWWHPGGQHSSCDAIICDGAVRSGKSLCLTVGFVLWSMSCFSSQSFGICGKTLVAVRRNLITPLLSALEGTGIQADYKVSKDLLTLRWQGRENCYYLFGGKDEGSAALIQGVTLAGVLLDEVALMPRSFVEQALARCSVLGSRFWFSCNPEHPRHWFYQEWVLGRAEKNALHLHFTMRDNPGLPPGIVKRYKRMFGGVFYRRYVLGEWCAPHGAVYPMFDEGRHVVEEVPPTRRHIISCDHGTVNPASFGLWGQGEDGIWYRLREYYHDSRRQGVQRTDSEYADALAELAGEAEVELVLVDPAAAHFIQELRRRGWRVKPGENGVLEGIQTVSAALLQERIRIHRSCRDTLEEFSLYRWDLAADEDRPLKEHDHAMDEVRYLCTHLFAHNPLPAFAALAAVRR